MTKKKKTKSKPPAELVYVCYAALASGAEQAGTVRHKASLVMMKNTPGSRPLALRPGVTGVSAENWAAYDGYKPLVERLESGEVLGPEATAERLSSKYVLDLLELIKITQDAAGLEHIAATERARERPRPRVLEAISKRAPKLWAVPDMSQPLVGRRPPAAANQTATRASA